MLSTTYVGLAVCEIAYDIDAFVDKPLDAVIPTELIDLRVLYALSSSRIVS